MGLVPTEQATLVNGVEVYYGTPHENPQYGTGFILVREESAVSSWAPATVSRADLLQYLSEMDYSLEDGDLAVRPADPARVSKRKRSRIFQVVPETGLLDIEHAAPKGTPPRGDGAPVPGGLLYRRMAGDHVSYLILDGGDAFTKMLPYPTLINDPEAIIDEAARMVVHLA